MNHVMTTAPTDLRGTQLADTRRRIAGAVLDVLVRDGVARVSFPAVAEQAGVSLRTVYRHFPNKERLVAAGLSHGSEKATAAFPVGRRNVGSMREFLPLLWHELYRNREAVQLQHVTSSGRDLRGARMRARQEEVLASLATTHPHLDDAARRRLAPLLSILMSSTTLFDLVDHLGLDIDAAADLVATAMETLVAAAEGAR